MLGMSCWVHPLSKFHDWNCTRTLTSARVIVQVLTLAFLCKNLDYKPQSINHYSKLPALFLKPIIFSKLILFLLVTLHPLYNLSDLYYYITGFIYFFPCASRMASMLAILRFFGNLYNLYTRVVHLQQLCTNANTQGKSLLWPPPSELHEQTTRKLHHNLQLCTNNMQFYLCGHL